MDELHLKQYLPDPFTNGIGFNTDRFNFDRTRGPVLTKAQCQEHSRVTSFNASVRQHMEPGTNKVPAISIIPLPVKVTSRQLVREFYPKMALSNGTTFIGFSFELLVAQGAASENNKKRKAVVMMNFSDDDDLDDDE